MAYPPTVGDALQREVGLDGTQRLLDVGCGPGSLTLLLAPYVHTAFGLDADPDMIVAARREADRHGAANVQWRHMRAEELPADLGYFNLVTFAQSLHWLDRPSVLAAVRSMIEPDGVCVHVQATTHRGDASDDRLAHPRPPHQRITELVASYLGSTRRAGRGSLPAAVFSLSSSAPHLFGSQQSQFEHDLRVLLHETAPDNVFAERTRNIALDLWRP